MAAALEETDILSLILETDADIDARDRAGKTPLYRVIISRNAEATQMLVKRGAKQDIMDRDKRSPLALAASLDFLPAFKDHYQKGALSSSILELAATRDSESIACLMEKMDRDSWPPINEIGQTPYHIAAGWAWCYPEVIVTIIQKAQNLGFRPESILEPHTERTALSLVASGGWLDAAKGIVENVASEIRSQLIEQADDKGMTPLF
ncbi:Ankyrin-1 [Fusarium oxysporum f. sp. rapae]|uniref:Ankyrin-1 n=1 Tax=Fusarium oxysporum f. sp. rapae TaxID=485398 RepID=A0A8J5TQB2_FUSOX|nr:Ankyrin-1 [Fusarium oxysporum f. sp. rapae]